MHFWNCQKKNVSISSKKQKCIFTYLINANCYGCSTVRKIIALQLRKQQIFEAKFLVISFKKKMSISVEL